MTPAEVRAIIIRGVNEWVSAADRPQLSKRLADPAQDVLFADLDVDSLAAAEISMLIEDETGYACDIADFIANPSIDTLSAFVAERARGDAP